MVLKLLTNFPPRSKENTHSPKQATKHKIYFYHPFFQSVALNTWNAPLTTLRKRFRGKSDVSVQWPKTFIQIFLFPEKFLKMANCTGRLPFSDSCLTVLLKNQVFFLKVQNWLIKQFFQVNFPILFLSACWSVVWHTWLKHFAKKDKEITQTPKRITEK